LTIRRPQKNSNSSRQVFWLPRPFSNLPITINRNSGELRLKEFLSCLNQKGRGYSGGTAPAFHGIPY
jgi:hypothetical protein